MALREPGYRYGRVARDIQFHERGEPPARFTIIEILWSWLGQAGFVPVSGKPFLCSPNDPPLRWSRVPGT